MKNTSGQGKVGALSENYFRSEKTRGIVKKTSGQEKVGELSENYFRSGKTQEIM